MEPSRNIEYFMDLDYEVVYKQTITENLSNESNPFSESEHWSPADSPPYSSSPIITLEYTMDQRLTYHLEESDSPRDSPTPSSPRERKRRGRKPIRPNDPVKKKTEEKDKYWLRAFRAYMKTLYPHIKASLTTEERNFWREHLGPAGKPEKGHQFRSYGRRYKDYLFSHSTFATHFRGWFQEHSEEELAKKYRPESDLWFVFYDYAQKDLYNYIPKSMGSLRESPVTESTTPPSSRDYIIDMVGLDEDHDIDEMFSNHQHL